MNWKIWAYLLLCLSTASVVFHFSSISLSIDYSQEQSISVQIYAISKYDLTVNFTIEIPNLDISTSVVQTPYYTLTKRPASNVKQIVSVNFHLPCNRTRTLCFSINELKSIQGWDPYHRIYYDLAENATNNLIVRRYFSVFVAVYTVKARWLQGVSEIPIFRDSYHYEEGCRKENNYTTERLRLLTNLLSVLLALCFFGIVLGIHPNFRPLLRYYPWLTLFLTGAMVLIFVFWTPAEFFISFGLPSILLSYFPHFDSGHLIGNLKSGIIILFLLESVIGWELGRTPLIRGKIVALIIASEILFWAIGMGGWGASYINEVLGLLLIIYIIGYAKRLTETRLRLSIYPFVCFFAGYALFGYIIDWAVGGYVLGSLVELADLHLGALAWGVPLVSISFLATSEVRRKISYYVKKGYTFLRSLTLRSGDKKSLALLFAGSLIGFVKSILELSVSVDVKVTLVIIVAAILCFLLSYGVGIPQKEYHEFILRHRWKEPLKIGVLNDMQWDINNREIFAWSGVAPDDWKEIIETFAKEHGIEVNVKFIDVGMKFDSYAAVLNPYGGVYPELDLKNLSTLDKILEYVKEGGLFINVADIPSYWAYNPDLHRRLDIASTVYAAFPTSTGVGILSAKPFELTPLIKRLGLRVMGTDPVQQDLGPVFGTSVPTIVQSERFAIVESNVDSCVPTSRLRYVDGDTYDMSALFFLKYGEGDFLLSLIWINATYHNQQTREALISAVSKLAIDKLAARIGHELKSLREA